jgi:hypothetical protein
MPVTRRQVEFLARAIVNRLEDRGVVEFGDAESGIEIVMRVLTDNMNNLDAIVTEARQRLARAIGEREPTEEELEGEVRRVASERNFVL